MTVDRDLISSVCRQLVGQQRIRSVAMKSRTMQSNRLQAVIAGTLGYAPSLSEAERKKKFKEADTIIEAVMASATEHLFATIIRSTKDGLKMLEKVEKDAEADMVSLVKKLHVWPWLRRREQCGFGATNLGKIIGETGDLFNYPNPAKLWRRLACAPWEYNGQTLMGSTWRGGKYGKLPASEWEKYGYSPRRRSITFLIGEGIIRQNYYKPEGIGDIKLAGPYRQVYIDAKRTVKEKHPDYPDLRCHRHGMLLATKELLLQLWRAWHGK